jgi:hypothetical protein
MDPEFRVRLLAMKLQGALTLTPTPHPVECRKRRSNFLPRMR